MKGNNMNDDELREAVRKLLPTLEYETGRGWRNVSEFTDKLTELIHQDRQRTRIDELENLPPYMFDAYPSLGDRLNKLIRGRIG